MPQSSPTLRRLKSFRVNGLFGFFDHEIDLNTDERITILHGPNGVGKTTILRLIESLVRPTAKVWQELTFSKVVAKFLPGGELSILPEAGRDHLNYSFREGRQEPLTLRIGTKADLGVPNSVVEDLVPFLRQVRDDTWHDRRLGDIINAEAVASRYSEYFPPAGASADIPDWFTALQTSLRMQFIETHRLRTRSPPNLPRRRPTDTPVVQTLADDLSREIERTLSRSGSLGASLDRQFPKRLLEGALPGQATEDEIRMRYQEQERLRNRLMAAGLLHSEEGVPLPKASLDEGERKVLWHYLDDVDTKLEVYQPMLEKIELFQTIISDKDFLYKSMSVGQDDGFAFTSDAGGDIPLVALSSGEQHELVLTYKLLFGSEGRRLILVDEPELSLHVGWQRSFLHDMERIAEITDLDFVLATHSPSIVGHRTDLMVELRGDSNA